MTGGHAGPVHKQGVIAIWYIDANVTVGSVQSEAIGPHQQEEEKEAGVVSPSTTSPMGHVPTSNVPARLDGGRRVDVEDGHHASV